MINKKEKKPDLFLLRTKKAKYERLPIIKSYIRYSLTSKEEKEGIEKEWADYYTEVRKSWAYERFLAQRDAFKKGDIKTVKDLATDAHQQVEDQEWFVKKPTSVEPDATFHDQRVFEYKKLCWEISVEEKRLKDDLEFGSASNY